METQTWREIGRAIGWKIATAIGRYNIDKFSPQAHLEYLRLQRELGNPEQVQYPPRLIYPGDILIEPKVADVIPIWRGDGEETETNPNTSA